MICVVVSRVDFFERPSSSTPIHYRSVRCLGEENRLLDCPGISEITTSCSHNQDAYIVCRPSSFDISRKSRFHFISYPLLQSHAMFQWMSHNFVFQCFIPILQSTYPNLPLWYCMSQPINSTPYDICVAVDHFPASVKLLFLYLFMLQVSTPTHTPMHTHVSTHTCTCTYTTHTHTHTHTHSCARVHTHTAVHTAGPQHGDIRLFADSDNGQGAVEFYHSSFGWTGICPDSSWGTSDATVACRQLGYETGRAVTYGR